MNVVVVIEGREAIPVRAIPLLTDWNSMTPDYLAGVLAEDDGYFDFEGLKAYYVEAGLVHRLEATWWESYCCRALKECSDNIKITHPELKTHSQWKRESLPLLPAGVFVWKDEYEALHEKSWRLRDYWRTRISPGESEDDQKPLVDRLSLADDRYVREKLNKWRKLNFSPRAQDSGIEHLVMAGFETGGAESEKYQLLWQAVRRDEHRVNTEIEKLKHLNPTIPTEIKSRNEQLTALHAELAQIHKRLDMLGSGVDVRVIRPSEIRYVIKEMAESRPGALAIDAGETIRRTAETRDANEKIDALIAEATTPSPAPVVPTSDELYFARKEAYARKVFQPWSKARAEKSSSMGEAFIEDEEAIVDEIAELQSEIEDWESLDCTQPSEKVIKQSNLEPLYARMKELDAIQRLLRGDYGPKVITPSPAPAPQAVPAAMPLS